MKPHSAEVYRANQQIKSSGGLINRSEHRIVLHKKFPRYVERFVNTRLINPLLFLHMDKQGIVPFLDGLPLSLALELIPQLTQALQDNNFIGIENLFNECLPMQSISSLETRSEWTKICKP